MEHRAWGMEFLRTKNCYFLLPAARCLLLAYAGLVPCALSLKPFPLGQPKASSFALGFLVSLNK